VLRKDIRKPASQTSTSASSTADPKEIERFTRLADEWWKTNGAFKVVHAFNKARVNHLAKRIPQLVDRDPNSASPLAGLSLLDVGCGAGLVTEPISRLGAAVLGIDAAERNILIAERHAASTAAPVAYRHALPEELLASGQRFDIVLSLEVVGHVASAPDFLSVVGRLVEPGGLLVIGTLNRTAISFIKAIVGAEYLLRWMPRGTHHWRKFVTPAELETQLSPLGFSVIERCGVELMPLSMQWRITQRTETTYLQFHRRQTIL
jgi:2-polyprenyl-6-hydroxyphenyl methylase/3-demethylubiquinone-9 3-methyltransferase